VTTRPRELNELRAAVHAAVRAGVEKAGADFRASVVVDEFSNRGVSRATLFVWVKAARAASATLPDRVEKIGEEVVAALEKAGARGGFACLTDLRVIADDASTPALALAASAELRAWVELAVRLGRPQLASAAAP
jgi:hypothetical protein